MKIGYLKTLLILGFVLLGFSINYADTQSAIVSATASTVNGANTAALSYDGNTGTRWESAQADPQWIYWDLGSSKALSKIVIDWETASASNYTIQGSTDAATWTILATVVNSKAVDQTFITNTLSGTFRYVKMNGTTRTTGWGYSIWEVYIFTGTAASSSSSSVAVSSSKASSIATSAPVSSAAASSTAGITLATITAAAASTGTPALSYDNNLGTRWESAQADPQWIYWDLGSSKALNSIIIDWEVASASNYTIQGSTDAATWTILATVVNSKTADHTQITNSLSGTYRYVKMNGTTRTSIYGYSIWEVYIYVGGTASSAASSVASSAAVSSSKTSSVATSAPVVSSSKASSVATSAPASSAAGVSLATITAAVALTGTPALSYDNNLGTRWESAQADPQWIYWDLGSSKTLNSIVIDWETASASNYTIQGSLDAVTWTILATVMNSKAVDQNYITNSLSGSFRYVKMNGTTRATIWAYSIWEVYIYTGTSGTGASSSAIVSSSTTSVATSSSTAPSSSSKAATSSSVQASSAAASSVSSGPITKSTKRGVAYNINTTADLSAIASGSTWWYSWSTTPGAAVPANYYQTYGVEFIPMLWGGNTTADFNTVGTFILAHPEVKYIMVLNEPNVSGQAYCTPAQAAANWPQYEQFVSDMAAQGRTIKIVGPQMTWGTMPGYEDPVVWLDAFIAAYQSANGGRSPKIDYLGYHWYDYGLSQQLDTLGKYGKQIWLSEFANWNANTASGSQIDTLAKQQAQMQDMANICEYRPDVFRYAWFTGRLTTDPHFSSLYNATDGQLSALGQEYVTLPYTATNPGTPDFGPNVYIFDPSTPAATIQNVINVKYEIEQASQFGPNRCALLFKPGSYNVNLPLGFYTSVYGLGQSPDSVTLSGAVYSEAYLANWDATCNFWRSVENFSVSQTGNMKWAVSQACPFRRMHIKGSIDLHDNWGWASGGFMADSVIDGTVNPGSQQQWISRNSQWATWTPDPGLWNMVFVGMINPPVGAWPAYPYTIVNQTPIVREKPYLYVDNLGNYNVFVPAIENNSVGSTWLNTTTPGTSLPISQFYIAKANTDTADTINAALNQGKNLLLTPGVYYLASPIQVNRANTVVLGIGYATLIPTNGNIAMTTADVDGLTISGILFDAGALSSPILLQVGPAGSSATHSSNPTLLADLFFRVGGAAPGNAVVSIQINCNNVIGDNFWVWRADHGVTNAAGWTINPAQNGLVVNGNNVTLYGMFVEHFEKYQTIWNGNNGRLYFYQSELPYDVPDQASWMDGTVNGYASYKVANTVTNHQAYGLGVYSIFLTNNITCDSAIECPVNAAVTFSDMVTVHLKYGNPSIGHIINTSGLPVGGTNAQNVANAYLATWGNYPANQ